MNILQKLTSATPAEETRVQFICLLLAVGVRFIAPRLGIPQEVIDIISGGLAGITIVMQLATKDVPLINQIIANPIDALPAIINALPMLVNQISEIHTAVTKPPIVALADAEAIVKNMPVADKSVLVVADANTVECGPVNPPPVIYQ
jgi:hypothetical protein